MPRRSFAVLLRGYATLSAYVLSKVGEQRLSQALAALMPNHCGVQLSTIQSNHDGCHLNIGIVGPNATSIYVGLMLRSGRLLGAAVTQLM